MVVLACCNHKGGSGKTTSAIHIGACLGLSGYRTILVDLDPQCYLTRTLGVGEPAPGKSTLALFEPNMTLDKIGPVRLGAFNVIPSSSRLTKRMRTLNNAIDVLWLKEIVRTNHDYDVVVLDTAAAVTVYSLNAMVSADYLLIPVTPEYQGIVGAEQTYRTAETIHKRLNPHLAGVFFLLTQVDARKKAHYKWRHYLRMQYEDRVLMTVIRTNAALSRAHADGTTTVENEPYSRGARDYANATDELVQRMGLRNTNAGSAP